MAKEENTKKKYQLRAKFPFILRVAAIFGLAATVLVIGIGFYFNIGKDEFRLKPHHTQLSEDVVGVVKGYERRESDAGNIKYYIKADQATTYSDEHQELENVFLQVFDENDKQISDKINADKAIYIPAKDKSKNFTIYFAGNVDVKTRYDLNIQTEQIAYDKSTEIADSSELVNFQRENVSGKSYGAVVNIQNKTLDLLKDVEINSYASDNVKGSLSDDIKTARLKSGRAFVDQVAEKIKFEENVEIYLTPKNKTNGKLNQPTDIKTDKAIAFFSDKRIRKINLEGNVDVYQKPTDANKNWTRTKSDSAVAEIDGELKKLDLYNNVQIETTANNSQLTRLRAVTASYDKDSDEFSLENNVEIITVENGNQTKITAGKVVYDKTADRFDLDDNVVIDTSENSKPTKITAEKAVYQQNSGKINLTGDARILQGNDVVRGNTINAGLNKNKKLIFADVFGDTYLKQENAARTTEVRANQLNAIFDQDQRIQKAFAKGNSDVVIIPANSSDYTKFGLFAPDAINLDFRDDGTLNNLQTKGRTTIKLNSPNNSPDAADKKLTADKINTVFRSNGNELASAAAIGNAELVVEPHRSSNENYKTVVNSPRFDCNFFDKNNAKSCVANGKSEVIRYPTVASRSKQNLSANKLNAIFDPKTQDIERFDASGSAKFSEGDRRGIADQISYTAENEYVRLRGGEPTVWDSNARAKAEEIDWDVRNEKSYLNGKVSTTYYSQKQTNGATPFNDAASPVFLTAANAKFDHRAETGLYTGNARAWQENNYIRADKIFLQQKESRLLAEGKVQSLLYDTARTVGGRKSNTPVYASADKMLYERRSNLIRYENNVDIRQGTDRIVAKLANVYLDKDNQLSKTVVENDVVITQPNRRASGTFAQYNAADESVILRGNPANVSDSESGSTSGQEVILYLKENRVVSNGSNTNDGTGRIRTVYKIKDGKIN